MEQTSLAVSSASARNLLSLGYNYCNNGTSQCSSGNTGSRFQHTIGWDGELYENLPATWNDREDLLEFALPAFGKQPIEK